MPNEIDITVQVMMARRRVPELRVIPSRISFLYKITAVVIFNMATRAQISSATLCLNITQRLVISVKAVLGLARYYRWRILKARLHKCDTSL